MKPGYKQTEVGVIPEEWEVAPLGKCLASRPSYGINAPAVPYSDRLPVYIRITDISEDGRFTPDGKMSVKSELSGNYYLSDGDIVFARTGASVGKSYQYNPNDGPLVFAGFLIRIRPETQKLLPDFVAAYVTTGNYWRWVRLMSMRSGQPGINGNEYSQLPIPCPPLPEQRTIAEALSDVDGLLGGLDRLIAKKRDLKQAAMQQLLTGQTRLPGFHGEWEVKMLGDVARLYQPETIAQSAFTSDGYPVFGANGVVGWYSRSNHETPQITVSCRGNCGTVNRTNGPAWITGNAMVINLDGTPNVERAFVYYALCHADLTVLVSGSGIPQIVRGPLQTFEVRFPPLPEQTAIAQILSDMDAELTALEQRREKTRALKQAMMQELLTGRTRLV
jgi:type I restriction enzyme S subunit